MNRELSIYLDLVRLLASLLVVRYHSNLRLLSTEKLALSDHGHAAVIVFFVLSGYVISYITATRENTPLDYWSSRLSRFYSLALPAVLLTPLLDMAGQAMAPQFYVGGATTYGLAWLRIATSLGFLNEVWFVSIMSFSNVPYWSLCYEMWYYVLFAVVSFAAGRARLLLTAAVVLLGPKILLLVPVWALGVLLQRWSALRRVPPALGWLLFLASWPLYGLFQHYQLTELGSESLRRLVGERLQHELTFSKFFLTDYPLALIVACNFVGFQAVSTSFRVPLRACEPLIRKLAACTFTIYILHQPLLQFYAALLRGDPGGPLYYWTTMAATLLTLYAIASVTERQRHRLRRVIRGALERLVQTSWWRRGIAAPMAGDGGSHV